MVVGHPNEVTNTIQSSKTSKAFTVHVNDLKLFWGDNHPESWLPDDAKCSGSQRSTLEEIVTPVDDNHPESWLPDDAKCSGSQRSTLEEIVTPVDDFESDEVAHDQINTPMATSEPVPHLRTKSKRVIRPPKRFGWD